MSQKMMNALVKAVAGPGLELRQVPVPVPKGDEVLIKMRKTAICGTDVHIYNWDAWSEKNVKPGTTIGHEYVGEIVELGANVTGLKVGQRISGEGHIVCGHCRNCRNGAIEKCANVKGIGVQMNGAFAEYMVLPAYNVMPVKDSISDDLVSFFDAYGNAAHTALMFDLVGEDVLITGAGPIGMMAVAICRFAGARRIVVTDVNAFRLGMAKSLGADAVVDVSKESLGDVMAAQGILEGFDVGLEMSGNGAALNQMITAMRNGGKISLLGIAGPGTVIDWNDVIFKCLTLQGIYGRKMETWYKMGAMIEGGLDLNPIITHHFHYTEFEQGFEAMNSGKSGKVILDWTK